MRHLNMSNGKIECPSNIHISSTPQYPLRGHQLGYRPKTNSYDAWTVEQFNQYIRDMVLFGANAIEIIPPKTDDDDDSPHFKLPHLQMCAEQSRIANSYGMDVWMWYPNMGKDEDYQTPDGIKAQLAEREEVFKKMPRLDVVFVPGGDPGDLYPEILFSWLEKLSVVLKKHHPNATIWVSPQVFRPTKDWVDSFYINVNKNPDWFGGVVFGPWVKSPLKDIRNRVNPDIPIRRYPDITHSISCQYPVPEWDLAYAMTLGRECINPRPVDHKIIHNLLDEYAIGSIGYSEGTNDDVNKFVWLDQDWNPDTPVIETMRDYSRLFISPEFTEDFAQGLMSLEQNWRGPLLANDGVNVTLQQFLEMEVKASPKVQKNFRFQMGLLRAYYDAYIKRRLGYETELENQVRDVLRMAQDIGANEAITRAESILQKSQTNPVAQDLYLRCQKLADDLFESIGAQLTVTRHQAISLGRGAFVEAINEPLNDVRWLLGQFADVRENSSETGKLAKISEILNRTNPGPGGFYDNFGTVFSWKRVDAGNGWPNDPGSNYSPRASFGVGLAGKEWVHEPKPHGFDGRATPIAWVNQVSTLYDQPLSICYLNLDSDIFYTLRVAYTGRFRSTMKLIVDNEFVLHDFIETGIEPLFEYDIPKDAIKDGKIVLQWSCPEGMRGAQVAELWLMKKNK